MKLTKITLCLIAIIISSTSIAFGYVIGSSNFGIMGYPEFRAYKPHPPYSKDSYAVQNYRREVNNYVDEAKKYLESANNDIDRIYDAKENAIKESNNVVDEFNRFVSGY